MITYEINDKNQPVNSNGEVLTLKKFPHFNGVNWFEFDSEQERQAFITANKPTPVWDKESHCREVSEAHTELLRSIYTERGYLWYSEVESWKNTDQTDELSLSWKAEATSIVSWYQSTCIILYGYMDSVTEETAQPVETFINSLPKFNH
jgi:hypothetical protein